MNNLAKSLSCLLLGICFLPLLPAQESYLKHFPESQLKFEENRGQFAAGIEYQTTTGNQQIRLLEGGISVAMIHPHEDPAHHLFRKYPNFQWSGDQPNESEALVWNIDFAGANPNPKLKAVDISSGQYHYLRGNDPSKWVQHISNYREVHYQDLYPGIDLRYYGADNHQLKYDLIVQPNASLDRVVWEYVGINRLRVSEEGNLLIDTDFGEVTDATPYAYQIKHGREQEVNVRYQLLGKTTLGFEILGAYDPSLPLIIDPLSLSWGSFFHSSTSDDYLLGICQDTDEQVYITGYTKTMTFPITPGVYQPIYGGSIDVYVAKFASDGTTLLFSTFLGGSNWDMAYGIGVNSAKEVFIAGFGASTDYPTTGGSFQPTYGGGLVESFVSKLSADGSSLMYSSYLGGTNRDYLYDLQLSPAGEVFVTGYTLSSDFPTTAGAYSGIASGNGDAFVTKVSADGSSMAYSTYFGGQNYDIGNGLALANNGEVFVTGNTGSTNLPTTSGSVQPTANFTLGSNLEDAFLFRLSQDGSQLKYATYLGGSATDAAYSVTVNEQLEAYITGLTYATDFPITIGAFQPFGYGGLTPGDAFVSKLDSSGSTLQFSTYLGGTDLDYGKSIRLNQDGVVFVLGATLSSNFPVPPLNGTYAAMHDIFLAALSQDGSALDDAYIMGGNYNDYPRSASSLSIQGSKLRLGTTTHSPAAYASSGSYQATKINGVADAPWIIGMEYDVVLPVVFTEFQATWDTDQQQVSLNWELSEEVLDGSFEIEQKTASRDWKIIGQQAMNQPMFADHGPWSATTQEIAYRIKWKSPSGESTYSSIQAVSFTPSADLHLRAHFLHHQLSIEYALPAGSSGYLEIWDVNGQAWKKMVLPPNQLVGIKQEIEISAEDLPSGLYFVRLLSQQGHRQIRKVLIW